MKSQSSVSAISPPPLKYEREGVWLIARHNSSSSSHYSPVSIYRRTVAVSCDPATTAAATAGEVVYDPPPPPTHTPSGGSHRAPLADLSGHSCNSRPTCQPCGLVSYCKATALCKDRHNMLISVPKGELSFGGGQNMVSDVFGRLPLLPSPPPPPESAF